CSRSLFPSERLTDAALGAILDAYPRCSFAGFVSLAVPARAVPLDFPTSRRGYCVNRFFSHRLVSSACPASDPGIAGTKVEPSGSHLCSVYHFGALLSTYQCR